jgi:TP901 family phage tail tape measure protein
MATELIQVYLNFRENLSQGLSNAESKLSEFKNKVDGLQKAFTPVAIASGAAIIGAIKFGAEWDKATGAAARGLDISGKELKAFQKDAENLAKNLSFQKSSADILNLATDIGKLGVAKNDVLAYTESIVKLATATDSLDKVEELSTNVAKIGNVFKFTSKDVAVFGGALNKLADATAATPNDILNVTQRLSGIGKQSKLSATQIAAWGATLISAGKDASTTATFMNSFLGILGAGTNLSKDAQAGLKSLGYEAKSLAIAFDKDANGTMLKFLDTVNKLDTVSQREILGKIFGKEFSDDAALLATQTKQLRDNLVAAGDTAGNIAKVNAEFKAMAENSLEGQMATLKNQMFEVGKTLGLVILPAIISINKSLIPFLNSMLGVAKTHPQLAQIGVVLLGLGVAVIPIASIVSSFITLTTVVPVVAASMTGLFTGMLALIPGAIAATVALGTALWTAFLPIAPFIAGIAGIAAGAYLIYKNWTPISNWFNNMFSNWGKGASLMWTDMGNSFNNSMSYMGNGINKFSNDFSNGFNRGMNNAGQSFNNWVNQTATALNQMTTWIWNGFNNLSKMAWDWGSNFVTNFVNGIKANIQKATDAVGNMTSEMGKFLPHSPSEKGAFRDLDKTGFAFTDTFLNGIKQSGLDSFFNNLFQAPKNNLGLSTPSPRNQNSNSSVQLVYSPQISGSRNDADYIVSQLKGREKELLDIIDKAIRKSGRKFY